MTADPTPDPLDDAFAALRRLPVPDRPADAGVLARLTDPVPPPRRRRLMRIATWSLAASVLAAAGTALLFTGPSNVALADVLKAAEKHTLVKFKTTTTMKNDPPPGTTVDKPIVSFTRTEHADLRAPRSRSESSELLVNDDTIRVSGYMVSDATKNRRLVVSAHIATPKAADPALPDHVKDLVKQVTKTPKAAELTTFLTDTGPDQAKTFVTSLREIETHKDATTQKDGTALVYTIVAYPVVNKKKTTVLRVDAKTKLPTKLTVEYDKPDEWTAWVRIEFTDFEWDPELKSFKTADELFSLTPPEGYTLDDQTKAPPAGKK